MAFDSSRVAVTGLGIISPIGIGKEEFWDALIKGKNGISRITSFDTSKFRTHMGGEVKKFNPKKYIKKNTLSPYCRGAQFAVAASRLAIDDAGLEENFLLSGKDRCGVILGSTAADTKLDEKYVLVWAKNGHKKTPEKLARPLNWFTVSMANSVACEFNISDLSISVPAACAAGNYSIGYAFDLIKSGRLDIALAGGVDPMNQLVFAGFNRFLAMAADKCRPFDLNRKGLIVSEGAAILVLESLKHAIKRKAYIYAEILGYGIGSDAYHPTSPHPNGVGAVKAIEMALKDAKITTKGVNYINAHGTGTIINDRIETKVIKKVFGKRAKNIPVSSIKSMLGHTMGAASAIEAAACALVVKEDIIPPTINYETPDPECDLDYVPNIARKQKINIVLSNSFGFGGNNGVLLMRKFSG